MTTDITELAPAMKAAAKKATPGPWALARNGKTVVSNQSHPIANVTDVMHRMLADGTTGQDAEFISLANPANILALVEALEKAKGMEAYWKTQCRGITDHCEVLQARIAELESRTVKLPAELYTIGELIRTQDNRITDQPMFVVFQKREIIGSDEHSPSRICWVWDGEEVSELRAKRLEALYQDGRDTRGYDRYAMQEVDEFVTACFTEHGCKDYLRQNGHNLRLPYIYACGSFRNNEYQLVRNWLAGIKVEGE